MANATFRVEETDDDLYEAFYICDPGYKLSNGAQQFTMFCIPNFMHWSQPTGVECEGKKMHHAVQHTPTFMLCKYIAELKIYYA